MAFESPWSYVAVVAIAASVVYAFVRKALLTFTLALALLVVYALEQVDVRVLADLWLSNLGGAWSAPWTWVTFQFLHASLAHLLFNLMALLFIAPVFEERIGSLRLAVYFFAGGAVGAFGFVLLNLGANPILVGASAGISAVFGAYGRLYPRDRVALFLPIPGVPALPVIDVVLGFILLETILSYSGFFFGLGFIAWQAHVIAMIFGLAAAPLVQRLPAGRHRPERLAPVSGLRALATTPELQAILLEAEASDIPELRQAWIEKFAQKARCPKCGGPLRLRFGRLASRCGWRGRLR